MNSNFINTFFETISNKKYRDEFLKSIAQYPPYWENPEHKKTYDNLIDRDKKKLINTVDEQNDIWNWQYNIENFFPRIVNLIIIDESAETYEHELVIKSIEELEIEFLQSYTYKKSSIFLTEFSIFKDYILENSADETEYFKKIEHFKFHFKSKLSTVDSHNQFHVIKSIMEGLKSHQIFLHSRFEFKNINSQFIELKLPPNKWEGRKTVIIDETQMPKEIVDETIAPAHDEHTFKAKQNPSSENNPDNSVPKSIKTLEDYKSDTKEDWQSLKISEYIEVFFRLSNPIKVGADPCMTEESLINSIERIYYNKLEFPKATINIPRSKKGFVFKTFYELYLKAGENGNINKTAPFIDIADEHFDFHPKIKKSSIKAHFRVEREKKKKHIPFK